MTLSTQNSEIQSHSHLLLLNQTDSVSFKDMHEVLLHPSMMISST
jgi:hypothetical protein